MTLTTSIRTLLVQLAATSLLAGAAGAQTPSPVPTAGHTAVGSWFGKAVQLCQAGVPPSACSGGNAAIALLMTATIAADGTFLGGDTLTLGGPPFGPHTAAHGQWIATTATNIIADYAFMLNVFPPLGDGSILALRFRWSAQVLDKNTLVGYVNAYFSNPIPTTWTSLISNEFPAFPAQGNLIVTPPSDFVTDPTLCQTAGCPLVFKFTVKRIAP